MYHPARRSPLDDPGGRASETTVLGLDNIPLDLPIAGAGSRALSGFLDYLIVAILAVAWGAACLALAMANRQLGWWMFAAFLAGFFVLEYGYFAGVEIWREGQTFGKWALGLRVVTRHGARPGTAALLIRNAVRTVDLFLGVPLMATDALARRLGDRLAGTLVIHTHAPKRELVVQRTPRGWDAAETALLESFLRRAEHMERWRAEKLARQLLDVIAHDDPALSSTLDRRLGPVDALRGVLEPGPA
jgi:uncharacterized RDD family membrane protein YckC